MYLLLIPNCLQFPWLQRLFSRLFIPIFQLLLYPFPKEFRFHLQRFVYCFKHFRSDVSVFERLQLLWLYYFIQPLVIKIRNIILYTKTIYFTDKYSSSCCNSCFTWKIFELFLQLLLHRLFCFKINCIISMFFFLNS